MQNNTKSNNNKTISTIELIEQLATQATLQGSSAQINVIGSADITSELKDSLINQDIEMLETQLNLENRIRCQGIHPGEAEAEEEQKEQKEEQEEIQSLKAIAF